MSSQPPTGPLAPPASLKTRAAALSVSVTAALVALKVAVGLATGAVSVLADAVHSGTDLMAAIISFFSVRASDAPPDWRHPYGHGKIEAVSGLAEAALIFTGAGFIISDALGHLLSRGAPHTVDTPPGLAVMSVSAAANWFLSRWLLRAAQKTDSLALESDARHLRVDILTSTSVLVGLALVLATGRGWFDPGAALLVSTMVLATGWRVMQSALQPLLDSRLPQADEAIIRSVLESEPRVLGYHKLRTRKAGSQRHVDVHVQVSDDATLLEAHDLTEELEDRIRASLPAAHVNIHTEPFHHELRHQQEAHGAEQTGQQLRADPGTDIAAARADSAQQKSPSGDDDNPTSHT